MEALVLILIGLITGFEVASSQQQSEDLETESRPAVNGCVESADAVRIANLEDPNAPVWVLQSDQSLCDPATGRMATIGDPVDLTGF